MTEVAEKNDNEIELTDQEYLSYKSFYWIKKNHGGTGV
jgi:hypothetical protein